MTPAEPGVASLDALLGWLAGARTEIDGLLSEHGALLLQGVEITDAEHFERLCAAIGPSLQNCVPGAERPRRSFPFPASASTVPRLDAAGF